MTTSFLNLCLAGLVLTLVQALAALPWIWGLDPRGFKRWIKDPTVWLYALGTVAGLGLLVGWFMSGQRIESKLKEYGYYYGALLHAQLALDFLVVAPQVLLVVWPKGGAVALSAFREGWRQPMFWLIAVLATFLIFTSMVVPYFTFGEDYKMMKQLGFDIVMLSSALFGLLVASISINEEIEGRTAITVMSKPINRRQFLIGKYVGILLACWAMTLLLGWVLTWALYIKPFFDRMDDVNDTMPAELVESLTPPFTLDFGEGRKFRFLGELQIDRLAPTPEGNAVALGAAKWFGETVAHHLGLLLSFGQVMVLVAICTALATRLQFVINLVICLFIFFIGHLAPVLVAVTQPAAQQSDALKLVNFIAQLISAVFPGLEHFDMGPAIIRDTSLDFRDFRIYVATVFGYAVLYSAIALLVGLFLFEDRDLA